MEIELLNPVLAFRGLSDEDQEEEVEIADNDETEKDPLGDDDVEGDDDKEEEGDPLVTEE